MKRWAGLFGGGGAVGNTWASCHVEGCEVENGKFVDVILCSYGRFFVAES